MDDSILGRGRDSPMRFSQSLLLARSSLFPVSRPISEYRLHSILQHVVFCEDWTTN